VLWWGTIAVYLAIAGLAMIPSPLLEYEGVLLTVLLLAGVHVALLLMIEVHGPEAKGSE
jgi:hypothetical protein